MEIDSQLATGYRIKRNLAAEYGFSEAGIHRHESRHLDPRLIEAAKATDAANAKKLVNRVDRIVTRLEKRCEEVDDMQQVGAMLKIVRELRPYQELYGKATKELGADAVTTFLIELGVRSQDEVRSRLAITRNAQDMTPEEALDGAVETLEIVWRMRPDLRQDALARLSRASYAEIEGTNGTPK